MADIDPTRLLPALAQLFEEIEGDRPLREQLDRVLDTACQLTHADTGAIGIYDPVNDSITTVATRYTMPAVFAAHFARNEGLAGYIIATGQRYLGRYGDLPRPVSPSLREHESFGLPLLSGDKLLGYLALSLAPPRRFKATDLELGEVLARIVSLAIERERLVAEERRSSLRFELVGHIAAAIQRDPSSEALLQRAADAIHDVLKYPNVEIPLIDAADPGMLVLRARSGAFKRIGPEDRMSIARGVMGAAVRERVTQMVNDTRADPRYVCPPGLPPAQAELAVPIRSAARVLGVLNIESDHGFSDLDRRSLEAIADYLAVTIENSRLLEQAGQAAVLDERARLARELHDNVTQILASMNLLSQTIAATWKRDPAEGEARAARLQQLAQTAFAEMRMLLRQLAPPDTPAQDTISRQSRALVGLENLRTQALPGALTRLLATLVPDNIAVASNFAAYVPQKLEHEEAFYRVCQEAVSNCLRHAAPKRLRVEAAVTGEHAVLRVADDGRGLGTDFRPGIGLSSMRTRIESLHGAFRVGSNNPHGTLIEARVPRADRELASPDQSR